MAERDNGSLKHLYRTRCEDRAEIESVLRKAGLHPEALPGVMSQGREGTRMVTLGVPVSEHEQGRRALRSYLERRDRELAGIVGSLGWLLGASLVAGLLAGLWGMVASSGYRLAARASDAVLPFAAGTLSVFVGGVFISWFVFRNATQRRRGKKRHRHR